MLERSCEKNLESWFKNKASKPLVIRGARQVGKTSLVRSFCNKNKIKLIEINFEELPIESFAQKNFSIEKVLQEIEILKNTKITKDSVLFIDEIQVIPKAYQSLRFFKEQRPDIKVIAAGSLLEMILKQENISAPVGRVEFLYLYPMSFGEYLLANNETELLKLIQQKTPFSQTIHSKLLKYFNEYIYIGGMPEAINLFIKGAHYKDIKKLHLDILESYRQDIRKYYSGNNKNILLEVFDSSFSNISQKVKYTNFSKAKSTIIADCLNTLSDLFLIHKVIHSNCSGRPIKFGENIDYYKIYFIDLGLLSSASNTPWRNLNEEEFNELINKGLLAEQFAAQELICTNSQIKTHLNYWLKDKNPKKSEVDFVCETEESVIVIEVKSGKTGMIKSLIQFMGEKKELSPLAIKLDLKYRDEFTQEYSSFYFTRDGKKKIKFTLKKYPLYMSGFILK